MIIPVLSVADYLIAYIFVLKYSRDPKDSLGLTHSAPTRRRSDQPDTPVARLPLRPPSVGAVPRGRWAAAPAGRRPPRAARRRIAPRPRASPARGRRWPASRRRRPAAGATGRKEGRGSSSILTRWVRSVTDCRTGHARHNRPRHDPFGKTDREIPLQT